MKCGTCGHRLPQHALDCPNGPNAIPVYSHQEYEADLRRENLALKMTVNDLHIELGRLALMFASMDSLSGEQAARYVGDLLKMGLPTK